MRKGAASIKNFRRKFFISHCQKVVGERFRVSLISGIENFYASEGYVRIFRRKFFVSQCQKTLRGNPALLCFRKFPVAKKFTDKMEGEVSRFPSKFFYLAVPKNFAGEPFCAVSRKNSGSNKFMDETGGGSIKIFRRKFFISR